MTEEFKEKKCPKYGFCEVRISRLRYRKKGILQDQIILYKCSKCGKIFKRISVFNPLLKKDDK